MAVIITLMFAAVLPGATWYTLKQKRHYSNVVLSFLAALMVIGIIMAGAWIDEHLSVNNCTDCAQGNGTALALYAIPIYGTYLLVFVYTLVAVGIRKIKK